MLVQTGLYILMDLNAALMDLNAAPKYLYSSYPKYLLLISSHGVLLFDSVALGTVSTVVCCTTSSPLVLGV